MNPFDIPSEGRPPPHPPIQWGMAGWDTDAGDPLDLGNATTDPADGPNLCRVTLFGRREPSVDFDEKRAQGQKIICRLADGVRFPTAGTLVVVAVPEPFGNIAGIVLATCSSNPAAQGNAAGDALVLQSPSGKAAIILRGDNIVLKTADAKGNTIFAKVGPNGFVVVHPGAFLKVQHDGITARHWAGAYWTLSAGGLPAPFSAVDSYAKFSAKLVKVDGAATLIGPDNPATVWVAPFVGLPTDVPPAGVAVSAAESSYVKVAQ